MISWLMRGVYDCRCAGGQLIADVVSLSLVHVGFRVSKVLPSGSVSEFVPFNVRRAEENRRLLGIIVTDRQYLRCDLLFVALKYVNGVLGETPQPIVGSCSQSLQIYHVLLTMLSPWISS